METYRVQPESDGPPVSPRGVLRTASWRIRIWFHTHSCEGCREKSLRAKFRRGVFGGWWCEMCFLKSRGTKKPSQYWTPFRNP